MRVIVAVAIGLMVPVVAFTSKPAWADCNGELKQLTSVAETLQPGRLKTLVYLDISRAQRDSAEADEPECADAIQHAQRLLKTMH